MWQMKLAAHFIWSVQKAQHIGTLSPSLLAHAVRSFVHNFNKSWMTLVSSFSPEPAAQTYTRQQRQVYPAFSLISTEEQSINLLIIPPRGVQVSLGKTNTMRLKWLQVPGFVIEFAQIDFWILWLWWMSRSTVNEQINLLFLAREERWLKFTEDRGRGDVAVMKLETCILAFRKPPSVTVCYVTPAYMFFLIPAMRIIIIFTSQGMSSTPKANPETQILSAS